MMRNMPFQGIIFDLDGTLVDSFPGIERSLRSAVREVTGTDIAVPRKIVGPSLRILVSTLLALPESDGRVEAVAKSFRALYDAEGWQDTVAYEGVRPTLDVLRARGMRLFVATNKVERPTRAILAHLGLDDGFEIVLCRDSVKPPFPSKAEMAAYLLASTGLGAGDVLLVGDSEDDALAARHNNVAFCWAAYGYRSSLGEGVVSRWVIQTLADLLEVVN